MFITGAAAGIGRACAKAFHAAGWHVGLYDLDRAGCEALAVELGSRCTAGHLDVTDDGAGQAALADFFQAAGQRLDVLVNNAGILFAGGFETIALNQQHAMVDVNVKGVLSGCHHGFAYLKQTPQACVINLCSASAIHGQPELATYAATKFAVRGLTEGLNIEWAAQGIRVCDVWPLFTQTAMMDRAGTTASGQRLGAQLTADDVAAVVLRAANSRSHRAHWLVGGQTKAFAVAMKLVPAWLSRAIVRLIARR